MKLFLAIDIPKRIKEKIYDSLNDLRIQYPLINWIPIENYHITVMYFGDNYPVDIVKKKINDSIYDKENFYLYSSLSDLFLRSNIVIYLDFRKERRLLHIENDLKERQFPTNIYNREDYRPHLTLGRCKIPSKQQYLLLKKKISKLKVEVEFFVSRLTLYTTVFGPQGPHYKKIGSFPLIKS